MSDADEIRGHDFMPPEGVLAEIPPLYATEDVPLHDKTVWAHWFCGAADWWLVELDAEKRVGFGWVDLGDPELAELGYFSLDELRDLLVTKHSMPLVVERDLNWTPRLLRHC